jgi:hypothetical protein
MAYSSGFSLFLCVLGTGLLTIGYQGLFDLAKQFLDPYDNESFGQGEDPLVVDTLIAETNAGSVRWMNGLEKMPIPLQKITDGDLSDFILPIKGYSVTELQQMEEKKKEQQKIREKAEKERKIVEEHQRAIKKASHAMIPARIELPRDNDTLLRAKITVDSRTLSNFSAVGSTSLSIACTAIDVLSRQNSTFWAANIPDSTSSACDCYVKKIEDKRLLKKSASGDMDVSNQILLDDQLFNFYQDKEVSLSETWMQGVEYVDVFDNLESSFDFSSYEEMKFDGKETRLSKILADEVWDEEILHAQERFGRQTFDDVNGAG